LLGFGRAVSPGADAVNIVCHLTYSALTWQA
jgi:hypothetical protein